MITKVTQRGQDDCVTANVAAVLNLPYEQVYEEFYEDYHSGDIQLLDFLHDKGAICGSMFTQDSTLQKGCVDFLMAPALNHPGQFHSLIADYRGDKPVIIDPSPEGEPLYTFDPVEPGERLLTSWVIECRCYYVPSNPSIQSKEAAVDGD